MVSTRWRRGRGYGPGLVVVSLLSIGACGDGGPGPVGTPLTGHSPATVVERDGALHVENGGAEEELVLYQELGDRGATLLFLDGRAATTLPDGGSAWAETAGGRVIQFDASGVVHSVLGGAPPDDRPLTRPTFVGMSEDGLQAGEPDGSTLQFQDGSPARWHTNEPPVAFVGGDARVQAATRTVFDISLVPLAANAPLLWLRRGGDIHPVGSLTMPAQAMLAPVANAGWVATDGAEAVYFASAVRPELHRYGADGSLEWTATWALDGVEAPRFAAVGGTLTPVFRVVQQAVAVGPDGWIYVLASRRREGRADRLLVFDPADGTLVREAEVGGDAAIYVRETGHVFVAPGPSALARTAAEVGRQPFPPFTLPGMASPDSVRLFDHLGKVVVVNFWASWCAPCRREMPLLDGLAGELDPDQAVVIGLNEDVEPDRGRAFLQEISGVRYPVGAGLGRLRDEYGYRGLPYTVVLDRDGRVAQAFYGFGESIEPIRSAVLKELGR